MQLGTYSTVLSATTPMPNNQQMPNNQHTTSATFTLKQPTEPPTTMVMEPYDVTDDQNLFSCAICGLTEGDSSNLTTQNTLQTNATVGCGHQL